MSIWRSYVYMVLVVLCLYGAPMSIWCSSCYVYMVFVVLCLYGVRRAFYMVFSTHGVRWAQYALFAQSLFSLFSRLPSLILVPYTHERCGSRPGLAGVVTCKVDINYCL